MSTQHDIFNREGDQWFARNPDEIQAQRRDRITEFLKSSGHAPKRILDIGCSNGRRLQTVHTLLPDAECFGIDPSEAAVADGARRFPSVRLTRGFSHDLSSFEDERFDAVIASFVFHWVDRSVLLATAAEIDRVLKQNGILLIQDFHPGTPCKTRYHHLPDEDVFTYKQPYWELFTASNLYEKIFFEEFLHDPQEGLTLRNLCALAVLEKRTELYYPTVS